jgi:hypothetical protein
MVVTDADREFLQAEKDSLKKEQQSRIATRDHPAIASVGLALLIGLAGKGSPASLLAIPVACYVLGVRHLANDAKISNIGAYIRDTINPALRGDPATPSWEDAHRTSYCGARRRKYNAIAADNAAFEIPAIAALTIAANGLTSLTAATLVILESCLTVWLGVSIARHHAETWS